MKLTKKSAQTLFNAYSGCGILFVNTGGKEIQIIEFSFGRNGKFYTMNGTELTERLNELSQQIKEQEVNG